MSVDLRSCLPAYLPTLLPTHLPSHLPTALPTCLPACVSVWFNSGERSARSKALIACLLTYLSTCLCQCLIQFGGGVGPIKGSYCLPYSSTSLSKEDVTKERWVKNKVGYIGVCKGYGYVYDQLPCG